MAVCVAISPTPSVNTHQKTRDRRNQRRVRLTEHEKKLIHGFDTVRIWLKTIIINFRRVFSQSPVAVLFKF